MKAELDWLEGRSLEPDWPEFPPLLPQSRAGTVG